MKRKIFSSFILTLLSSMIFFGFNFILAKILGADIYGQIIYYLSFVSIISLIIGFNYPALYMGSKILEDNKNTFDLFFTIETLLASILFIPLLFIMHNYLNSYVLVILIILNSYLNTILLSVGLEFNAKKLVSKSIFISLLLPRIILIIVFAIFFSLNYQESIYYLYSLFISNMILFLYIFIKFKPSFYIKFDFFKRAWKFYLLGVFGLGFNEIAKIFQKEYSNFSELASLGIVLLIFNGLNLVGSILIKYVFPKLHEAWKEKNIDKINKLYKFHTLVNSLINLPILLFLSFNIEYISILLGKGYENLPFIFYLLSIGYIFDLLTGITGSILKTTENEHFELFNEIIKFMIGLFIILFFKNVILAITISIVIFNISKYIEVYFLFKLKPLNNNNLKILSVYLIPLIMIFLILNSFILEYTAQLILNIIIIIAYYITLYFKTLKKLDFSIYN